MSQDQLSDLMSAMRQAFEQRDWDQTLVVFQQMGELSKLPRNHQVESICLASRAMTSLDNRPGARRLLKLLPEGQLTKPVHYALVAQAYMDLKNYKDAARMCEMVVALQEGKQT